MTEKILPGYIGENIERSKQRKALIDEIIDMIGNLHPEVEQWNAHVKIDKVVGKLQKLNEIS